MEIPIQPLLKGESKKAKQIKKRLFLQVGNVDHVAQVDDQMTVEVPEPESKFYTVKSVIIYLRFQKNIMVIQTNTIKFLKPIDHYSKCG